MRPTGAVLLGALGVGIFQVLGSFGAADNQPDRRAIDAVALVLVLLGPLALAFRGRWPMAVAVVANQVGLSGRGGDRYRSYSLGMKQRLGIAAALLGDPRLLILDEPANGLDPQGVREMRSLLGRLVDGNRTVLVSSHDLSELEQVCDWLVLIDTGRSVFQGPTRELLDGAPGGLAAVPQRPEHRGALHQLLVGAGHRVDARGERLLVGPERPIGAGKTGPEGADLAGLAARVNQAAFEAGIVLVELSPQRSSLEDRYLSLVNGDAR